MSVYLVAQLDIHDRGECGKYEAGFLEIFAKYGGELLAVDENVETIEGEWPYTRTVLLQFPSAEDLQRWYRSPEYQELAQHRFQSARANIIMAQGLT